MKISERIVIRMASQKKTRHIAAQNKKPHFAIAQQQPVKNHMSCEM